MCACECVCMSAHERQWISTCLPADTFSEMWVSFVSHGCAESITLLPKQLWFLISECQISLQMLGAVLYLIHNTLRLIFLCEMNSSVFWVIMWCEMVWNWCFRTTCQSHLQGPRCLRRRWDQQVVPNVSIKPSDCVVTQKMEEFRSALEEAYDFTYVGWDCWHCWFELVNGDFIWR